MIIKNENGIITTESELSKKITNRYYVHKCENLDKKYKFLKDKIYQN